MDSGRYIAEVIYFEKYIWRKRASHFAMMT